MKIAIIGSGISGLTCGYHLHQQHELTLFEANDYIGGHTATIDIELDGQSYAVDSGFIVYNERTYPNFIALMDEIGVSGRVTQMSFSVRNEENGLEYNGHTLATLFAQRSNLFNLRFYGLIKDIVRFNRLAKKEAGSQVDHHQTLGEFLKQHGFSDYFCINYILPMGAAIWSSSLADLRNFPLLFFLRFFLNHGLLDIFNRPKWYVINGGSREYIVPLTSGFKERILLNSPVSRVERRGSEVLVTANGKQQRFDAVIFACHSDEVRAILADMSTDEEALFMALDYQANDVVLHTDTRLLPQHRRAWAAWNYWLRDTDLRALPALTYNMNILQHIDAPHTFCVSLNCGDAIAKEKILRRFTYHHPVFTPRSLNARRKRNKINGLNGTWFCGAYWYNGFHEDGVRSALDVVRAIKQQEGHV